MKKKNEMSGFLHFLKKIENMRERNADANHSEKTVVRLFAFTDKKYVQKTMQNQPDGDVETPQRSHRTNIQFLAPT